MEFINLTPHEIAIVLGDEIIKIPAYGQVARCREVATPAGEIAGIPIIKKTFGEVEGLPEASEGVMYITSALVAQAAWAAGRRDVLCPGDPVRDSEGRVIGCRSLCAAPQA